ncbi:hypothetical protein M0802_016952 [Mischocyttarus mexicanus]|nr:hypothetical protein M0802_016952 [Mischocyttarus mexicanus]
MRYRYPLVVCYYVLVNGLYRFGVGLHPAYLPKNQQNAKLKLEYRIVTVKKQHKKRTNFVVLSNVDYESKKKKKKKKKKKPRRKKKILVNLDSTLRSGESLKPIFIKFHAFILFPNSSPRKEKKRNEGKKEEERRRREENEEKEEEEEEEEESLLEGQTLFG